MDIINICPNCCNAELEGGVCPNCSYVRPESFETDHTLPVGKLLSDRYFIGKVLGEGGFGITYIGYDTRVNLRVAVKEYFPKAFANRTPGTHSIYSYSGEKERYFNKGLDRFMKEAKRIAKFAGEPAVVNVSDTFRENGTAYIIMEYVDGDSLRTILKEKGRISEKDALELITPIIETLAKMHKDKILHRDIAPDNIMVQKSGGKARLIDFGSATEQDSSGHDSTVVMVKHGFAPVEQYDLNRDRQGTWTDVYAICATLYNLIEDVVPVDAQSRQNGDKLKPFTAPISITTKRAILRGLKVSPEKRTQTMDALLEDLKKTDSNEGKTNRKFTEKITDAFKKNYRLIGGIAAAVCAVTAGILIVTSGNPPVIDVLKDGTAAAVVTTAEDAEITTPSETTPTETTPTETTTTPTETTTTPTEATTTPTETTTTPTETIATTTETTTTPTETTTTTVTTTTTAATTTTTTRATTTTTPATTTAATTRATTAATTTAATTATAAATTAATTAAEAEPADPDMSSYFPDIRFRQAIREALGLEKNAPIPRSMVVELIVLDVSGRNISSIEGIEYFKSLDHLMCNDNNLTSLPELPRYLTGLDCRLNSLTTLPELPEMIRFINCSNNLITVLPELPDSLMELYCASNNLQSLPTLPPSLEHLDCDRNRLSSLPKLPVTLVMLNVNNSRLETLEILPPSLEKLYCANNKFTSLPDLPNTVIELDVWGNSNLDFTEIRFMDGTTAFEREKAGKLWFKHD